MRAAFRSYVSQIDEEPNPPNPFHVPVELLGGFTVGPPRKGGTPPQTYARKDGLRSQVVLRHGNDRRIADQFLDLRNVGRVVFGEDILCCNRGSPPFIAPTYEPIRCVGRYVVSHDLAVDIQRLTDQALAKILRETIFKNI